MTLLFSDQSFNPAARVEVRHYGGENLPLVIIDKVLKHPEALVAYAAKECRFAAPPPRSFYPGQNAPLPPQYGPALVGALRPLLSSIFGIPTDKSLRFDGFFGLATVNPDDLKPLQRIPHFDSSNPLRLAMIHYLCHPPYEGTGLYRHLSTGFESITSSRLVGYKSKVDAELEAAARANNRSAFMSNYEQIDRVDAVYDRLAIYRTTSLHAGLISTSELSEDPSDGRLTANGFIEIHPS